MNLVAHGEIVDDSRASTAPVLVAAVVAAMVSDVLVVPPHLVAGRDAVAAALDHDAAAVVGAEAVADALVGASASVECEC